MSLINTKRNETFSETDSDYNLLLEATTRLQHSLNEATIPFDIVVSNLALTDDDLRIIEDINLE